MRSWLILCAAGIASAVPARLPVQQVLNPTPCGAILAPVLDDQTAREADHAAEYDRWMESLNQPFSSDPESYAPQCATYTIEEMMAFTASQRIKAEESEAAAEAAASNAAATAMKADGHDSLPIGSNAHRAPGDGEIFEVPSTMLYTPEEDWGETLPLGDIERAEERMEAAMGAARLYSRPDPFRLRYSLSRTPPPPPTEALLNLDSARAATPSTTRTLPDLTAPTFTDASSHTFPFGSGGGKKWSWRQCPGTPWRPSRDAVTIESIQVSPDPPVPGENVTVSGWGTLRTPVHTGSDAEVIVRLGLAPVYRETLDLCRLAEREHFQLQCPISPGTYHLQHTVQVPKNIPRARYNAHITAENHLSQELLCLDVGVDFSPF